MKRFYQLVLIYLALFSYQYSFSQSVISQDTVWADNTVFYKKTLDNLTAFSTRAGLLPLDSWHANSLGNIPELDGEYIDEAILYQTCKDALPDLSFREFRERGTMPVNFYFNADGNIVGIAFMLGNPVKVSPKELLKLQLAFEQNIHIALSPTLKANKGLNLLKFNFQFEYAYAFKPGLTKTDTLHSEWINNDIRLFQELEKIDKNRPQDFEKFFKQFKYQSAADTLGFGWVRYRPGKGAGYISVNAEFYYYKNKIVTYILSARIPRRSDLKEKYKAMYSKLLPLDSGMTCYYKYHEANILKPLNEYRETGSGKHIPIQMLKFMSPQSGIIYGYAGGLPVTELFNRHLFNNMKDELTNEQLIALMYSINPASRLIAIEYYYRNKERFRSQPKIEKWIQRVYKERPNIESISGCIIYDEKPQVLVESYLKMNVKQ